MKTPPKYAHLNLKSGTAGTALRLDGDTYIRDHGHWQVGFKLDGDKLVSVSPTDCLDGAEIVEISQTDWATDNRVQTKG